MGQKGLFVALDVNSSIQKRSKSLGRIVDKYLRKEDSPTVQHLVASASETLPFADNTFDKLIVNQSKISDSEAYRVLRSGGRLLISYVEALTVPVFSSSDWLNYRRTKFKDVRMFPGMPSTAFYTASVFLSTHQISPVGIAMLGLN